MYEHGTLETSCSETATDGPWMGFRGKQDISVYRSVSLTVVEQGGIGSSCSSSDDMFGANGSDVRVNAIEPGAFTFVPLRSTLEIVSYRIRGYRPNAVKGLSPWCRGERWHQVMLALRRHCPRSSTSRPSERPPSCRFERLLELVDGITRYRSILSLTKRSGSDSGDDLDLWTAQSFDSVEYDMW
jgi:hypothetical protein